MLGQLTGINAIMYFMSVLMSQIGFNDENANYMSLVGGGSLLLGTIPAIFLMESFGRRFWAIVTLPGFFIGLVLIGISYRFDVETDLMTVEGLYLTGLILYQGFFGSYACLTWGMSVLEFFDIPDINYTSGPVRSLPDLPPQLRHDDVRRPPIPNVIYRNIQLHRNATSHGQDWSGTGLLRRHCSRRRNLPDLLHA